MTTVVLLSTYFQEEGGRGMKNLTEKQKRFADEYIINGGNATQAALTAGYSERTARSQGHRLLTNVGVKKYIEGRLEEIQDESILKQKEILVMLSEIGAGKVPEIKEVVTKKAEYIKNENDPKKLVMVYNEHAKILELPTRNGDRIRALETLGKFYGIWTDNQNISAVVTPIFVDDISDVDD